MDDPHLAWKSYVNIRNNFDEVSDQIKALRTSNIEREFSDLLNNHVDSVAQMNTVLQETFERQNDLRNDLIDIQYGLQRIDEQISELCQIVDYNLSAIIEQSKITNDFLSHISYLLSVPNNVKERDWNIETGIRHFENATHDNSLYQDSLYFLKKANKSDYTNFIALYYLGMIYLFGSDCIDIDEAIKYFISAGKYAGIESQSENRSPVTLSELHTNRKVKENKYQASYLSKFAADCYYYASLGCYIKMDFRNSELFAKKAIGLDQDCQKAHILYCRSLIKNDDVLSAVKHLSKYLLKQPKTFDIILADPVFFNNDNVVFFLKNYKDNLKSFVFETIEALQQIIPKMRTDLIIKRPWVREFIRAKELLKEDTLESMMKSYHLLNSTKVEDLSIAWIFDFDKMYYHKGLGRYAVTKDYLILPFNNYISIYKNQKLIKSEIIHDKFIKDVAITSDGKYCFTCSLDCSLILIELGTYGIIGRKTGELEYIRIAISHDMKLLAVAHPKLIEIFQINLPSLVFNKILSFKETHSYHCNMDFSINNKYFGYFQCQDNIIIFNVVKGMIVKDINTPKIFGDSLVRSLKFSNNEDYIAFASDHGILCVYNILTDEYKIICQTGYPITKLLFSPDDKFIMSDSSEEVIVWDIEKGKKVVFSGYNMFINSADVNGIYYDQVDFFKECYPNLVAYINFDMALFRGQLCIK